MSVDLARLAELAKLDIPAEMQNAFAEDVEKLLKMVENLPAAGAEPIENRLPDVDAQPASAWMETAAMCLREDAVKASSAQTDVLRNAANTRDGCFVAPQAVE